MRDDELASLVSDVRLRGWAFSVDARRVTCASVDAPADRDGRGTFDGLGDGFDVGADWTEQRIAERLFAHIQFLTDHELREGFTVRGVRVFEPHDPSVTGEQHDWFVERQSALRGY